MLHFLPLTPARPGRRPLLSSLAPKRHDGGHLAHVRAQGCAVRNASADWCCHRCSGSIEAHHVRTAANSGMGLKPPDSAAVGLCRTHHRALHDLGRKTFERSYGIDLTAIAARLWIEAEQQRSDTR